MSSAIRFIIKWGVRALTALLFIIGVTDIPTFIAGQVQFFQSLGGETLIRVMAVLLASILGLVAIGPERIEASAKWASAHWPGRSGDEKLRQRCRHLSEEIYEYVADRRRGDPAFRNWLDRPSTRTEEEAKRQWIREREDQDRYATETMVRYAQKYEAESLALFDAAARRGWVDPEERWRFECPTNPTGIQLVAQRLGAIGHRV